MFFFFKQKTAYEMRISDWSSDVCSSDLGLAGRIIVRGDRPLEAGGEECMGGCGEIYRRLADDEARRFGGQFLEAAPPGVGDLTPGVAQAAVEALGQRFFRSGRGPGIGAGIVVGDIDAGHQADSQACLRQVALKVEATAVERVESGRELLVDSGKGVLGVSRHV